VDGCCAGRALAALSERVVDDDAADLQPALQILAEHSPATRLASGLDRAGIESYLRLGTELADAVVADLATAR